MQLANGSLLQGGKYRIEKLLGQGGFGITYLAIQDKLNRKVCIKEFFMKEHCNRDATTSFVTIGSQGSRDLVERFKTKFIKEAETIASLNNTHIVRIFDIFEENGTAYYTMELLEDSKKRFATPLSIDNALDVISQIGDALQYIHSQNVLHLDVKPSNIMFRGADAVLIDFGISKRYDDEGGQTSTTPVGISKGYAPLEQYNQGMQSFTPATDVYSLAATLFRLLIGETPPEATAVMNEGLPIQLLGQHNIPQNIIKTIEQGMEPRVRCRISNIGDFLTKLKGASAPTKEQQDSDVTSIDLEKPLKSSKSSLSNSNTNNSVNRTYNKTNKKKRYMPIIIVLLVLLVGGIGYHLFNGNGKEETKDLAYFSNLHEMETGLDSLSYYIGMSQTQGLNEYLSSKMGVDSAYIEDFCIGVIKATHVSKIATPNYEDDKKEAAYNAGIQIGNQIETQMIPGINSQIFDTDSTKTISKELFLAGFIQGASGITTYSDIEEASSIVQSLFETVKSKEHSRIYADYKKENEDWLKNNSQKDGVITLPSGLQYKILKSGSGRVPNENDRVNVHYEGKLIDGTVFDSSYERNESVTFSPNQVIKGFGEALCKMPVGSKWIIYIPQNLAYGDGNSAGQIKPYSTLIFTIELLGIEK